MAPANPLPPRTASLGVGAADFLATFGEPLAAVLDTTRWSEGGDLGAALEHLRRQVEQAVQEERTTALRVREEVFPRVPGGVRSLTVEQVAEVQRSLLFPGLVEAADGASEVHDSLPLTVHQVSVALVSYDGSHGAWQQRLYRRDVTQRHSSAVEDLVELLEGRGRRSGSPGLDPLSDMAQRGILAYGERSILLRQGRARWRLGHGSPAPLELLTGGSTDLAILSIRLLRELIEGHQRVIYVATGRPPRDLITIGQGLRPLEFLPMYTLADAMNDAFEMWRERASASVDLRWDGEALAPAAWVARFRDRIAARVVVGAYRATRLSPPRLFYAHEDHFEEAGAIALADACLDEKGGVPMLLTTARQAVQAQFGGTLAHLADAAYAECGVPFRYRLE